MARPHRSQRRKAGAGSAGSRRPAPLPPDIPGEAEVVIESLGQHGDGVGTLVGHNVFVPGTAPGDRVRIAPTEPQGEGIAARPLELIEPGEGRATPPCPHADDCGGCRLQHLRPDLYTSWKRSRLTTALARQHLDHIAVGETIAVPPRTRRRATFAARRLRSGVVIGFNREGSSHIVDMTTCTVLRPAIVDLLPRLRTALSALLQEGESADVHVTDLDDGLDVLILGEREPDLPLLGRLSGLAEEADLARISWRRTRRGKPAGPVEPIAHRRPGIVRFAGIPVVIPPGGFLQATAEGEAALRDRVLAATADVAGRGGRIADLFCGAGAFALPLAAAGAVVAAADSDAGAVDALTAAANGHGLAPRLSARRRDLYTDPLTAAELAGVEAIVFDPPRPGAHDQAAALAESAVPIVVAVSCNPASFARDARLLIDGGYLCDGVTPVDQFLWSMHLELVAVFRRRG